MYGFVGLGNPGRDYSNTRHNLGFMVLDRLSERWGERFRPGFGPYAIARARRGPETVFLVKPTTFMNRSGAAAADAVRRHEIPLDRLLVVCDDFNLPLGALRLRLEGSDGGHNGLASVAEFLGTTGFARLRLGIDLPRGADAVQYVLSRFSKAEKSAVEEMVDWAADALEGAVENGYTWAMNRFNRSGA